MMQWGVKVTITCLVFAYESGDCPLSFFAKHQLPVAKNNERHGAHIRCSLVDLKVIFVL